MIGKKIRKNEMSDKKIAVLLADGFEEGEALLTVDVLRRAGFTCDTVSVGEEVVCGSHGIRVLADRLLTETDPEAYDMVVLPGGLPGADTLRDNETVLSWVRSFAGREDRYVAAICAAPQVLARAGITRGRVAPFTASEVSICAIRPIAGFPASPFAGIEP